MLTVHQTHRPHLSQVLLLLNLLLQVVAQVAVVVVEIGLGLNHVAGLGHDHRPGHCLLNCVSTHLILGTTITSMIQLH